MANGFGNRFLWFVVKSDKVMPFAGRIPEEVFEPFVRQLRALHKLGTLGTSHAASLDDDAREMWEELYRGRLRKDQPGLAGMMVSRGPTVVLRIALIYAALDWPTTPDIALGDGVDGDLVIRPDHLNAAVAVWDYCEASARMLFQTHTGDRFADKLLRLLADGPMKRDDFNRHLGPNQKKEFPRVIARLEREGLVKRTEIKHKGAGRPATSWEIVTPA
jgi:hypothetical protein